MSVKDVNNLGMPFLFTAKRVTSSEVKMAGSCKTFEQLSDDDPELLQLFVLKKYHPFLTESDIGFNKLNSDQRILLYKSCIFSEDLRNDEIIKQIFLNRFSRQTAQYSENLRDRKRQIQDDLDKIFEESSGELLMKQLEMKQEVKLLMNMDPENKLMKFVQDNGKEIKKRMFEKITKTIDIEEVKLSLSRHLAEHIFHGTPLEQIDTTLLCALLNHLYYEEVKSILSAFNSDLPVFFDQLYLSIVTAASFKKLDQVIERKKKEFEHIQKLVDTEAEKTLDINIFKQRMKDLINNVCDLIQEKRTLYLLQTTIELIPETEAGIVSLTNEEKQKISESIQSLFTSSLDPIRMDVLKISYPREIEMSEYPIDFRGYLKCIYKKEVEVKISRLEKLIESNSDFSEFLGDQSHPS